jgi:hypothetical protein
MSEHLDKPPYLPFDILTVIAHVDIRAYKALLALPRFGRRSLSRPHQFLHQTHFTTLTITANDRGYIIHEWHLNHRSTDKGYFLHSTVLPDGDTSPAFIKYDSDDQKIEEIWYEYGKIHRIDGPARIRFFNDGQKFTEDWWERDQIHRLDGPAHISYNLNGQRITEKWYKHDDCHRLDGPAIIHYDPDGAISSKYYYLHDSRYTKENYKAELLRLARQM